MTWIRLCDAIGPSFVDDGAGHTEYETKCQLAMNHDIENSGLHLWWNDDGTIRLEWASDYVFGDGRWRKEWN